MIKVNKVNISIIDKNDELGNSRLDFKISGSNIDYIIVNSLRRTIFTNIPIYTFNDFKFEKNNSIFHNNYVKLRLQQMPVWGIKNMVDFIDNDNINNKITDKMVKIDEEDDDEQYNDPDTKTVINSSSLNQLTMYINYKNKSNQIMSVTTSHAKFYYDEKQIQSPYKNECLIVKLQPGQEFALSSITKLGIEEYDTMYSAVSIVTYKQINENEFDFSLESRGQISEKRILQVALINIERNMRKFLKVFLEDIKKSTDIHDEEGLIIVHNQDHTLGNLISRGMQQHSKIKFAGYNLPHPLAKKVHFHYQLNKGGNIIKIMEEVIEYFSELFNQIGKQINKL